MPGIIKKEIVVTKRNNDFHAQLASDETIWGCGATEKEAIGNLIFHHREYFDIEIIF